jgi:hypothetical protein
MTWAYLVLLTKRIGFFLIDNWRVVVPVAAGAIIVLWLLGWAFCSPAPIDKDKIIEKKIESNILGNQANEVRNATNELANNSNQALNNFNEVLNKDSSSYNGSEAERKFCTNPHFCNDSSCVDFRRRHPEVICKPIN